MHTDINPSPGSDAIITSALARKVPVISARQMLTWLDGRNSSSFSSIVWRANDLRFTVKVGTGAHNLQAMLPTDGPSGRLISLKRNDSVVPFTEQIVKGISYAFFTAENGNYVADYDPVSTPR